MRPTLLRFTTSGALALLLVTSSLSGPSFAAGGFKLPGVLGDLWPGRKGESREAPAPEAPPVRLAQAGDPRITELEEQVRRLSGTLEELNFQILQMQEQMRKQQEDFEFRFQEIEGGKGSAKKADKQGALEPRDAAPAGTAPASEPMGTAGDVVVEAPGTGDAAPADSPTAGTFGSITFDASGNVAGGSVGDQAVISRGADVAPAASPDATVVAALPATDNPDELYRSAYDFILAGDYAIAEAGFRDHASRFPEDPRAADAQFWLGEALLAQDKNRDAAEVFLAANKAFPKAKKAPDMLFKLGVSLKRMNQRDVACATFKEVSKRYSDLSEALKKRLAEEQGSC